MCLRPKLGDALRIGLRQSAADAGGIQVGTVNGGTRLLAPRILKTTSIHAVEAKLIQQVDDHCLGLGIVAGDRERNPLRAAGGFSLGE